MPGVTARIHPRFRPAPADNSRMRITYASMDGAGPAYEIEADRQGNYTIRQEGVLVKRVTSVTNYPGKPRWGSRKLELAAVEEAKAAIEAFHASQF